MRNSIVPYDEEDYYPSYSSSYFPSLPTITSISPESVLAEKSPLRTIRMLEKASTERHYENLNAIGSSIANTYVSGLSPEHRPHLKRVICRPKVNFGGLFSRDIGMVIEFHWK